MTIIIVSEEAKRIDKYVQEHSNYDRALSYIALLIITLMLTDPSLTNVKIADVLQTTQTLPGIKEGTVKSIFNYNAYLISQAILQATGQEVTVRKKTFKNTMERHILKMNQSDIIGILQNAKNKMLSRQLCNQPDLESAQIIRKTCQDIINMIDKI